MLTRGDMSDTIPFAHTIDRSLIEVSAGPPPLLLILHGSGDDEFGLLDIGRRLAPVCGGALVVSLRGPLPRPPGYCWFEGSSAQPAPDAEASILMSVDKVLQVLQHAPLAFGTDPKRAFLFGHSQGATVGWAVALSSWPCTDLLRGVVCNAGRLFPSLTQKSSALGMCVAPTTALAKRSVFCAHGRRDMITPVGHGRQNVKYCEQLGIPHTYHEHDEGHNDMNLPLAQAIKYLEVLDTTKPSCP